LVGQHGFTQALGGVDADPAAAENEPVSTT
jgi:hypothetical protein